jgi:hypothetical protein
MDVKCSGASITVQPYYLSALNTLSKNYFGADKRAMAPEQLAERGGVNQAESAFQEQLRRLKGDLVNQSASHLTVALAEFGILTAPQFARRQRICHRVSAKPCD